MFNSDCRTQTTNASALVLCVCVCVWQGAFFFFLMVHLIILLKKILLLSVAVHRDNHVGSSQFTKFSAAFPNLWLSV